MSRLQLSDAGFRIDEHWLVRNISMEVVPGYVTAVAGPNGSGKSTLLRMLAGLWHPTEGEVSIEGIPYKKMSRRIRAQRISIVPQDTRLDFSFTVQDVVLMGRHPHLGRFAALSKKDMECVNSALERTNIAHIANSLVNELSMGERQRVLIARCLATEAAVILLDEPTANLDIDHSLELFQMLREMTAAGKAVAVVLHDLNAIVRWADYVVLLHQGRLIDSGTVTRVLDKDRVESVFGVRTEQLQTADGSLVLVFHHSDKMELSADSMNQTSL